MIRSQLLRVAPSVSTHVERVAALANRGEAANAGRTDDFLRALLDEQQDLSAVERFAHSCGTGEMPGDGRTYRALLPATPPGPGQQLAFEVDLDACSGCKACVAACHSLNGLDEGESWRTAGLLVGGTSAAPIQQTITTSCHHCVDPGCMRGCPVQAYEKDPTTGIVIHLDDQCIGCGYCTFMCPYDAPRYSAKRGIVRKCDMCSQRLAVGEAPACVQACPSQAIRIAVVDTAQSVQESEAARFVPGATTPADTVPTTQYVTKRSLPANLLPADYYAVRRSEAHPALVFMLVVSQLSVGAYAVATAFFLAGGRATDPGPGVALASLLLGVGALGSSLFHLGRPHLAFRALLGLRTSWLSREIAAFSAFVAVAAVHAASYYLAPLAPWRAHLGGATAGLGMAAVGCSVMVYAATQRPAWGAAATGPRFYGSAAILGSTLLLLTAAVERAAVPRGLVALLLCAALAKLLIDGAALRHLSDRGHGPLRRVALVMATDLRSITVLRFTCAIVGGVIVPAGLLITAPAGAEIPTTAVGPVFAFACCLAGELFERHLFFAAAPRPRMPGVSA